MKPLAILMLRVILGLVFLFSGALKLMEVGKFAGVIAEFGLVPESTIPFLSIVIPSLELICGLLLVLGVWTRVSAGIIAGLLLVFIAAIVPNIAIGTEIDCGCFGSVVQRKIGVGLLLTDIATLCMAGAVYLFCDEKFMTE